MGGWYFDAWNKMARLNSEKSADFLGRTCRPAMGAFLREIDGKIAGMPRSRHNTVYPSYRIRPYKTRTFFPSTFYDRKGVRVMY